MHVKATDKKPLKTCWNVSSMTDTSKWTAVNADFEENFSQCNFSCPSCRFGPCKSSFREKYFDQQCVRFSTGFVWYSPAKSSTGEQHKNSPVVVIMSFLARNVTRSLVQVSFILIVAGKCLCNHPFALASIVADVLGDGARGYIVWKM